MSRPKTKPCVKSGSNTPMRRDPDSNCLQWLALTRHNNSGSIPGAISPSSSTFSIPIASPNIGHSGRLCSRSSATSYFAFLCASEDTYHGGRLKSHHKHQGNVSGLTSRYMDSSWVSWFAERAHQRSQTDLPDEMMPETTRGSGQSFLHVNQSGSPSENPQLLMQSSDPTPAPENAGATNTATTTSSTTTQLAVSGSLGTTTLSSPDFAALKDSYVDSMSKFPELSPGFSFGFIGTPADGASGSFDPIELDAGLLTWLDEQHDFAFNLSEEIGKSYPTSKRSSEASPCDCTYDGPTSIEDGTSKKQKIFHAWTNGVENIPITPF